MSYKIDLSDIDRAGSVSVTQQIVDRFAAAIDAGVLVAGARLPTTRALAEDAGVNALTAARAYKRLAELGYVSATVGRGTFVRSRPPVPAGGRVDDEDWQVAALPRRSVTYSEQMLSDLMHHGEVPGLITLGAGWPSAETFPTGELAAIGSRILERRGEDALLYLSAEGHPELRAAIAARGVRHGFAEGPDDIVVTNGGRQALDLVARTILEPGDVAVIESPTFTGGLTSLESTGARILPMPMDEDGADIAALERILTRHDVKLVAVQPTVQNPYGTDMSEARRSRLIELARERSFFVLEDLVYASVRFAGDRVRSLRAEAPSHVISVESLSKTIGGGLRIGWIAGRGPVMPRIAQLKLNTDLHTATLPQLIAAEFIGSDAYDEHIARAAALYRERCDVMLASLERHLSGAATWTVPNGGHHIWLTFDRPLDERLLYTEAQREGMSFLPGGAQQPEPSSRTSLRLSFSMFGPEQLEEGVHRLTRALANVLRRDRIVATAPIS